MKTLHLPLLCFSAFAVLAAVACDAKERCVADCDAVGATDSATSGPAPSTSSASDTSGNDPSAACIAAEAEAFAFLEPHRQCSIDGDCTLFDAFCFPSGQGQCGDVAVSQSADPSAWEPVRQQLEASCECGAAACGANAYCIAGTCESSVGLWAEECERRQDLVDAFLDGNRACEEDTDCQYVDAGCYDGPLKACVAISLNLDADLEQWEALAEQVRDCGFECGGNECGASIHCIEGACTATFP